MWRNGSAVALGVKGWWFKSTHLEKKIKYNNYVLIFF